MRRERASERASEADRTMSSLIGLIRSERFSLRARRYPQLSIESVRSSSPRPLRAPPPSSSSQIFDRTDFVSRRSDDPTGVAIVRHARAHY